MWAPRKDDLSVERDGISLFHLLSLSNDACNVFNERDRANSDIRSLSIDKSISLDARLWLTYFMCIISMAVMRVRTRAPQRFFPSNTHTESRLAIEWRFRHMEAYGVRKRLRAAGSDNQSFFRSYRKTVNWLATFLSAARQAFKWWIRLCSHANYKIFIKLRKKIVINFKYFILWIRIIAPRAHGEAAGRAYAKKCIVATWFMLQKVLFYLCLRPMHKFYINSFKSAKQLACSPTDWIWLVFTYTSNQSY